MPAGIDCVSCKFDAGKTKCTYKVEKSEKLNGKETQTFKKRVMCIIRIDQGTGTGYRRLTGAL